MMICLYSFACTCCKVAYTSLCWSYHYYYYFLLYLISLYTVKYICSCHAPYGPILMEIKILYCYCKNHITGSHIYYLLIHTFDLHFCTLILFSVITLNFTTNFLSALKLQSGIISFLFISYHDAITAGPSLSLAPPVSGGEGVTLAILQVMNPILLYCCRWKKGKRYLFLSYSFMWILTGKNPTSFFSKDSYIDS
jgi:hypothetical protein